MAELEIGTVEEFRNCQKKLLAVDGVDIGVFQLDPIEREFSRLSAPVGGIKYTVALTTRVSCISCVRGTVPSSISAQARMPVFPI